MASWSCSWISVMVDLLLGFCRPVGEVEDASSERPRIHQLQGFPISPLLEETLAASKDDGMDHEPELVEQAIPEQRPHEGAAADDRDVLAGLPLQLGYPLHNLALDQGR